MPAVIEDLEATVGHEVVGDERVLDRDEAVASVMKIVWNPHPERFPAGSLMMRHARRAYNAAESTLTLFEAAEAKRGGDFDVPSVGPGRYMVQIFDGTEGGSHYTWGFFTVASTSSLPRTGVPGVYWVAAFLMALGLVLVVIATPRAKPDPPPDVAAELPGPTRSTPTGCPNVPLNQERLALGRRSKS